MKFELPRVAERFLKYVKYDTQSAYESDTYPSTSKQLILAKDLAEELKKIGLVDVHMDEYGYVFGRLKANIKGDIPKIGFLAHMDTTPEMTGKNVKAKLIEDYDGGDIVLNKEENIVLSPKDSPELKNYIGETLITSDGTTLLGADDKAGIAEIITAIEYLINNPEIPHGEVKIAFTPDEEVGRGVEYFDIEKFDVDFAYTLDGGPIGEIIYETFNAAMAKLFINGRNVHPGLAKDLMVNSIEVLMDFNSMIPVSEKPEYTEDREGYYHLLLIEGDADKTKASYYIRDHDREKFEGRKEFFMEAVEFINRKYGKNTIEVDMEDQYYNMGDKIKKSMHIVDTAVKAAEEIGLETFFTPMRGGTDGAWLTEDGLPTANLFIGGHNYHGRYEYIPVHSMEKASELIVKIIELYSSNMVKLDRVGRKDKNI